MGEGEKEKEISDEGSRGRGARRIEIWSSIHPLISRISLLWVFGLVILILNHSGGVQNLLHISHVQGQ